MSNDFNNINFKELKEAVIHIEVDGTNYLQDTILKFGFYDGVDHVVIDSDQLKEYPELIKWLENETTEKLFMMLKTYVVAHRLDIDIKNIVFDVMLASYIIDPSRTIDDVNSVVSNYNQNFVQDDISIYGKGKETCPRRHNIK